MVSASNRFFMAVSVLGSLIHARSRTETDHCLLYCLDPSLTARIGGGLDGHAENPRSRRKRENLLNEDD